MTISTLLSHGKQVCSLHLIFSDEDAPVFLLEKSAKDFLESFLEDSNHLFVVVEKTPPITLMVALINAAKSKGVSLTFLCQGEVQGDFYPLELL